MSANGAVCKRMFAIVFANGALTGWVLAANWAKFPFTGKKKPGKAGLGGNGWRASP